MNTKVVPISDLIVRGQVEITEKDYQIITQMIHQSTGIKLGKGKHLMVQSRLGRRLRELKLGSFSDYIDYLNSESQTLELPFFINSITTNKTEFFREMEHFNFLKRDVLNNLLRDDGVNKTHYFWSAACSSGEEVYSLAMMLDECQIGNINFRYKILGTDIDTGVLEKAVEGVYSKEQVKNLGINYFQRYFSRGVGDNEGKYRIVNGLKKNIKFRQFNLVDNNPFMPVNFDVIFLRNVMIYFDRQTIQRVISYLGERILPGGYLFIGHSETLNGINHKFESIGNAIFKKY